MTTGRRLPVRVRPALRTDVAACAALFAAGQQEIDPRDPPWRADEFAAETAGEDLLAAAGGDDLAGFLSLSRADGFVHFLHVAPAWRRQGLGRSLLAAARAEVGRPLELKCLTGNKRARAFYRRLGWRVVNESLDPPAPYLRLRQRP